MLQGVLQLGHEETGGEIPSSGDGSAGLCRGYLAVEPPKQGKGLLEVCGVLLFALNGAEPGVAKVFLYDVAPGLVAEHHPRNGEIHPPEEVVYVEPGPEGGSRAVHDNEGDPSGGYTVELPVGRVACYGRNALKLSEAAPDPAGQVLHPVSQRDLLRNAREAPFQRPSVREGPSRPPEAQSPLSRNHHE